MTSAPESARRITSVLSWNYGGAALSVLLQLGYTAWTARAAPHTAFGSYAIALTLAQLPGLFATAGLATCVLRAEQLTRGLLRSALRLSLLTGVACWAVIEVAAPWCAAMWRMPEVTSLLRLLGCQYLAAPAGCVLVSALRRVGRPGRAAVAEFTGQAVGCTAAAVMLGRTGSPAALALAIPVAAFITLALAACGSAKLGLPHDPVPLAGSLLRLSGFLTCFALLRTVAGSGPLWMAGRLLGPGTAGLWSRAQLLSDVPLNVLVKGLNYAAVPLLAERRGHGLPLARPTQHLLYAASAGFVAFGALAGAGPAALAVLLGPGWEGAAALVPAFAATGALQLLYAAGCSLDLARGSRRDLVRAQLVLLAVTGAGLAAAARWPDPLVFVAAGAAGLAVGHAVQLVRWHRMGAASARAVVHAHLTHLAAGGCLAAAGGWGNTVLGGLPGAALAMAPVLLGCVLLRGRLPAYRAAAEIGLLRRPGRAKRPMTAPVSRP
ncbi:oligosaccharide flippase family protein [Streptomyces sp. TRM68367]|uniref:oligosaccharide flippase family protein n=1 Tax=Streptomyces sp. TRM68367 TaxID=2758415 RepID=UPI00165C005E|nr:oligosaccharide flippase family protein [Streptomyces sp. TRM68367]MBC9726984.1 oligosaccharide flippase family protein [Streptomyces sp. TRM68367]